MRLNTIFFLILAIFFCIFAVNNITFDNTYQPHVVLRASQLNEDNDSTEAWADRVTDTLNDVVPRLNTIRTILKDSTFQKINVDSIRSNPNIDSISGDVRFLGSPIINGTITVGSTASVDSLASTKKISSAGINSSGDVKGTTGTYSSTVTVDSLASTKKISSAGINSSGDVKGTTGTYSSTVTLSVLNISPSTIDTVTNNTIDFKSSYMNIVTSTGTDTLETINGGLTDGNMLIIVIAYSNSLFIKAATGNIWDDNHTISAYGTAMFIYNSTIGMWISID